MNDLMHPDPPHGFDGSSRLLVKAEWDAAEEWMKNEEKENRIAP